MTVLIILFVSVAIWFIYELIKANHKAKHQKHFEPLKKNQKIKYREITEKGFRLVDAIVVQQYKSRVDIKTEDDKKVWTVDRKDCFIL